MKVLSKNKNFLNLNLDCSSFEKSKIVIVPINFKNKTKHPAYLIYDASKNLEKYDEEMNRELCYDVGICSFDVLNAKKFSSHFNSDYSSEKFFVFISDSIQSLKFITSFYQNKYNSFSILHLDANARMKSIPKLTEESVIKELVQRKFDIIQVGIRSLSKDEVIFKSENFVKQFLACEINLGMFGENWQEIVARNLKTNVFISINLNVFDPIFFDNILSPEPGGLTWNEIIYLLKIIGQDKNIIGIDINGISYKKTHSNYFISKMLYKIMNYAINK